MRATPRLIVAAIGGYRRRRGWLAWHIAALGRTDDFPELEALTGPAQIPHGQDDEKALDQMMHNVRIWGAVLDGIDQKAEPGHEGLPIRGERQ